MRDKRLETRDGRRETGDGRRETRDRVWGMCWCGGGVGGWRLVSVIGGCGGWGPWVVVRGGGGEWGMRWWVELDLRNVRNSPHIFVASPDN